MDVDSLLEPVAGDDPCGDDLSFSREFDAVEESRRADDPTLAQGDWTKPLKSADWPGVAAQCRALLQHRTKDLRVAVWLGDAWSQTDGIAGLADGLLLCAGLCEIWWDRGLHPRIDDGGDASARVGSLDWLLGRVVGAARSIQVDDRAGAATSTPPDVFAANAAAVRRAAAALARLEVFVDGRLGAEGPAFADARKALDDIVSQTERLAPEAAASAPSVTFEVRPASMAAVGADPLQTRDQALRQLRAVADFFRRTEPHSPVAYLADQAAAWGEMPLHDWLRAVLKDPTALAQMEELLGVPRPAG